MDGTLVDNFTALHKAFSYAHEQIGVTPPTYEQVVRCVGESAPVTMGKLVGEDKAGEALPFFNEYFAQHMLEGICTLPGTLWLLAALQERGIEMALFTNKTGRLARPMCEHLKIDTYFKNIIGAGDTPWRKPQKEFSLYALEQMNASAESTAMIGDSPYDLRAAQCVGIRAWLVATGSHSREELAACEPPADALFDSLFDLGEQMFSV